MFGLRQLLKYFTNHTLARCTTWYKLNKRCFKVSFGYKKCTGIQFYCLITWIFMLFIYFKRAVISKTSFAVRFKQLLLYGNIRLAHKLHCCFAYMLNLQLSEFRSRASSALCESLPSSRLSMYWSRVSQKGNHGKNCVIILFIINENTLQRFEDATLTMWTTYYHGYHFGDARLMAKICLQLIFRKLFSLIFPILIRFFFDVMFLLSTDKFWHFCCVRDVFVINNYSL